MTGGQNAEGSVGVPEIVTILVAHGASQVLITTDDVEKYKGISLPSGPGGRTSVWCRDRILEAQEHLSTVKGVTVLIHDQACAAQTRRERKRGLVPTPTQRVVINHRICEACGDCGDVSNCLSVQPIDTPLGTKTTIDQSTCNFDLSCLEGDCPSFMTVEVGDPKTATGTAGPVPNLPLPELAGGSELTRPAHGRNRRHRGGDSVADHRHRRHARRLRRARPGSDRAEPESGSGDRRSPVAARWSTALEPDRGARR